MVTKERIYVFMDRGVGPLEDIDHYLRETSKVPIRRREHPAPISRFASRNIAVAGSADQRNRHGSLSRPWNKS